MDPQPVTRLTDARRLLALVAFALLPVVVASDGSTGRAVGWAAGAAVIFAVWDMLDGSLAWVAAAATNLVAALIGPSWFRGTAYHGGMIALAVVGLVIVLLGDRLSRRTVLVAAAAASLVVLGWCVTHDPGGVLDVALMHEAGADALAAGSSPWEGLTVPSGAPGAEGTVITGYAYPPVTLVWYSIGDWITGDARASGVVGWVVVVVATLGLRPARREPAVLLMTSAALPLLLWTGWTELLTVALMVGAIALWSMVGVSSVLFGLALATKQYMVVLVPVVLALGSSRAALRKLVSLAVAAVATLAGFVMGPQYLDAIIFAYSDFAVRSDSSSIYGFVTMITPPFALPSWLAPVVAVVTATWLGVRRSIDGPGALLDVSAIVLAVFFVLGNQSFANYWFIVWAMLLVARCLPSPPDPTVLA